MTAALSLLDTGAAGCLLPLTVFILLNGLDDVVLEITLAVDWVRRRFRSPASNGFAEQPAVDKRIAIFVPLWQEHDVIRGMVEHNIAAMRCRNYDFFIGVYPNDDRTRDAVRELEARFANVHSAVCPHDGPTSKADCLNWIYQRMLLFEETGGLPFDIVVVHDAEDVIHPDALDRIRCEACGCDMVQVPVLPLSTPLRDLVHGIYCDEFAEYQTKDIPARQIFGAFLPSNGVGTGFSRASLDALAAMSNNQVFDPVCLTEDYESGLRLHRHGFTQKFVRLTGGRDTLATREFFPRTLPAAIRQRTRWITGISLQSWDLDGWRGGLIQRYWFWRDRKGLIANPVGLLANLLFAYGLLTWILSRLTGSSWGLGRHSLHPLLFTAILTLQLFHMGVRMVCVSRHYGWWFACGVPVRAVVANYINCVATLRAEYRFFRAKVRQEPLLWLKTDHAYPSRAALLPHKRRLGQILTGSAWISEDQLESALATQPAGVRLGEHLVRLGVLGEDDLYEALGLQQGLSAGPVRPADVDPRVARALPLAVVRKWKVMPFQVAEGSMVLASPEIPGEEISRVLRPLTTLTIRFHLVTPRNFAALQNALL